MTVQKKNKIKIIVSIILIIVALTSATIITLSVTHVSHAMSINKPNQIAVFYKSESNNVVYEQGSSQYDKIYNSIMNGFKQKTIDALTDGKAFKDVIVQTTANTEIEFKGIIVQFNYDLPQTVKYKKDLYMLDNNNYWYQSLVFNITDSDTYRYNSIAIIPPPTDALFIAPYAYNVKYLAYSNFKSTYDECLKLF